jgi:hypothetical protein
MELSIALTMPGPSSYGRIFVMLSMWILASLRHRSSLVSKNPVVKLWLLELLLQCDPRILLRGPLTIFIVLLLC